ncbi:MAG: hypothetical protein V3S07_10425, partial [Micropepsaceae bacterium]
MPNTKNDKPQEKLFSESATRRHVLAGAALAAAGAALSAPPVRAQAQTDGEYWSNQYWAMKGDVRLAMYRRRIGAPTPGEAPKPVLFLVHGSSNSSMTNYDLHVPDAGEYSTMNIFAREGYDVWTMDFEGYGLSTVTEGNSDIATGILDLAAATAVVTRETGQEKMHFWGNSSGALRAGA